MARAKKEGRGPTRARATAFSSDFKYDLSESAKYSVSGAVQRLNDGSIPWEYDYAIVYSNREKAFFLLAKAHIELSLAAVQEPAED